MFGLLTALFAVRYIIYKKISRIGQESIQNIQKMSEMAGTVFLEYKSCC